MGALTRSTAVVGVLAAVAAAPAAATTLQTSLSPATVGFGDRVTLRLVVQLDDRQVRPGSFRVTSGFAPLTQLGRLTTSRRSNGHVTTISVAIPAACLSDACVASPRSTAVRLPPLTARVIGVDGTTRTLAARWERLQVLSRVSAHDLAAAKPPFRTDTSVASPTFRFRPHTLALALDLLAALLAISAAILIVRQFVVAHRSAPPSRRSRRACDRRPAGARVAATPDARPPTRAGALGSRPGATRRPDAGRGEQRSRVVET